jgi:hypothetical protein
MHQPDHTFMLATAIMKDVIVVKGGNDPLVVVQGMAPSEIEALQQRIIKRWKATVVHSA